MPLSWQVAWRFRQSKRQNGYISFISASSTIGIGLGCAVLILLLSVMNGFESELKNRLLSLLPHGELSAVDKNGIQNWQQLTEELLLDPEIKHVQPYVKAVGMVQKGATMKAVELTGLDVNDKQYELYSKAIAKESWDDFSKNEQSLLLGRGIMEKLSLKIGDKVQILLPQLSEGQRLSAPITRWLTVAGSINIGGEIDSSIGMFHIDLGAQILNVGEGAQGIQFYYHEPFNAPQVTRRIAYTIDQALYISDWTRTQGHLYNDIQLVRVLVYVALVLLIAVACFNIISTLVMAVNEKQSEIAVLKTMGATNTFITKVFVIQGAINGVVGTFFGVILGVVLATNVTAIANWFEQVFGQGLLAGDIYFIDFLPSELQWPEVYVTAIIALLLSFFATLYPAMKAAKIEPTQVLGH
ncbi:lipoprotein-releasing ABC transporter permease subunit LolE [Alteromonadaceae bacterium M269]|nr:lipoprotein-releasing ABC transporter permease subunit LolE [Alteromonadaceae bacterium M269]